MEVESWQEKGGGEEIIPGHRNTEDRRKHEKITALHTSFSNPLIPIPFSTDTFLGVTSYKSFLGS